MRSRAQFRAHPIHPALIPFPFAFLTAAAVFDAVGVIRGAPALWTTGAHLVLAGLAAGVVAAVPGAIDYLYTVPPASSGKARASTIDMLPQASGRRTTSVWAAPSHCSSATWTT